VAAGARVEGPRGRWTIVVAPAVPVVPPAVPVVVRAVPVVVRVAPGVA